MQRRHFLVRVAAAVAVAAVPPLGAPFARESAAAAIGAVLDGAEPRDGADFLALEIAPYVEDGNQVPVAVVVQLPEGEALAALHLFADGNPDPRVARFGFGQAASRGRAATRIRLHRSQMVTVLAETAAGRFYATEAAVEVAVGACS